MSDAADFLPIIFVFLAVYYLCAFIVYLVDLLIVPK